MNIIQDKKTGSIKIKTHNSLTYPVLFYKVVRIYTTLQNGQPLADKETEWFYAFVTNYNEGIKDYLSEDAMQNYMKLIQVKRNKAVVSNYIKKCREKGWIETKNGELEIPPLFKKLNKNEQIVDFEIRLVL